MNFGQQVLGDRIMRVLRSGPLTDGHERGEGIHHEPTTPTELVVQSGYLSRGNRARRRPRGLTTPRYW
jgi:hypothetical protein